MRRPVALLLVALSLLLVGPAAFAGEEPDEVLRGELELGFDGTIVPGRPTPVRVSIDASELVTGELGVRVGHGPAEVVPFEVTGGTTEEHWLLVDSPVGDATVASLSARTGDRRFDLDTVAVTSDAEVHLVGALGGLGDLDAAGQQTVVGGHEIRIVRVAPEVLDLGANALAALDSIAATPADLAGLPDGHRDAVLGWLTLGGTLYVDAPPGPLADWPDALQPSATTVRAGAAAVVATGGALAEGRWRDVVLPAPNRSLHEDGEASANLPYPDLGFELSAVDLGRDLPALAGLLVVIAVYTLLVGPVAYLALRRRVMARWAVIPVLAVLATGLLYVQGDGRGSATAASVVDVIETGPGGAMASTRVFMATDRGGQTLEAPAGWPAAVDDAFGFGSEVDQRRGVDGVTIDVPAPAGGVGVLLAKGPVDFDGGLDVTATAVADGTVVGTVRNTTSVTLGDVAVFAGRAAGADVGTLEPGASADFELTGTTQFRFAADPFRERWWDGGGGGMGGPVPAPMPMPMPPDIPVTTIAPDGVVDEIMMETCDEFGNCTQCDADGDCISFGGNGGAMECDEFGNCFPMGMRRAGSLVRADSLTAALRDRGTNAMAPGLVTAVGWTADLAPVVDLGGGVDVIERRTAIVARAVPTVDHAGDGLVDAGVVRTMISSTRTDDGLIELAFRFDLPTRIGERPVDPARLRIDVPAMWQRLAFLTPAGEVVGRDLTQEVVPGEAPPQERQELVVPPAAVVGDAVFVVAALPFAPPGPGRELVVYEAAT